MIFRPSKIQIMDAQVF